MGVFDWAGRADVMSRLAYPDPARRRVAIRSPWTDPNAGNLPQVMAQEILGVIAESRMTREAAMRVPAVARARQRNIAGWVAARRAGTKTFTAAQEASEGTPEQ